MRRILPDSLKGLLLFNESAFLVLVLVTATLTGLWAWFWTQSSQEAARIEELARLAERVRGNTYRQLHEVTHARLTENPAVLQVYSGYRRQTAGHFAKLRQLAHGEDERAAVDYLHDAYLIVLDDMEKVFTDPNEITEAARMKLLDPAYEQWMLGELESALTVLEAIAGARREALDAQRSRWTRWAPVVVPVSVVLAVALLLFSRRSLQTRLVGPLRNLVEGTVEISRGNLDHRVPAEGAGEIRQLASTFGEMTRQLAESQRILVESERRAALGALVPVVAHNVRNPLASIRATAQMMDDAGAGGAGDLAESRRAIIETVDRLERWVTALLSYLVPLEPRRRECRLGDVVRGALAPLEPKLDRKGLRVVYEDWEQDAPLQVDPDLLEQAIHALLGNAVDASPARARIRLGLARADGAIVLRIDDEGPGISFEPDPRELSPGPSTKRGGHGLGIPVASKICRAHGGTVDVRRRDGGGTRATVTLPLPAPPDVHRPASGSAGLGRGDE